jgi:cystathionine beta-lyase
MLRARGSFKWTAPGPGGLGAAVAEMDFGAAPPILDELAALAADAKFGYLPPPLAAELAQACAEFQARRFGWQVDPELVHDVPDVLKVLELAITYFSRPASPVILPTPAYMPFLTLPGVWGREVIQVRMLDDDGYFRFDIEGINEAFRAGGHLLILCNPYNPLGRVCTAAELAQITEVVDRHGGRVFADEIHAPLIYPGERHIPYASTSDTAAGHTPSSAIRPTSRPGRTWDSSFRTGRATLVSWPTSRRSAAASRGWPTSSSTWTAAASCWPACSPGTCRSCATGRRTAPTWPGSTAPRWNCRARPAN